MITQIKHIYKYITSPTYRYWSDFCTRQEFLNKNMNMIEDKMRLETHPMFICVEGKLHELKEWK